jgi:hypothetical protein
MEWLTDPLSDPRFDFVVLVGDALQARFTHAPAQLARFGQVVRSSLGGIVTEEDDLAIFHDSQLAPVRYKVFRRGHVLREDDFDLLALWPADAR